MRRVPLSLRLKACADMVETGSVAADVGCDHGWVSIYLVLTGVCPKVIATDLREGPLSAAREHIRDYGLMGEIETRLSDGLGAVKPGEAGTVILLGMGGRLILDILEKGQEVLRRAKELVIQPQSEIPLVRRVLRGMGFQTLCEELVLEDGKYYFPMKLACSEALCTRDWEETLPKEETINDRYGFRFPERGHPLFKGYLLREKHRYEEILEHMKQSGRQGEDLRMREIGEKLKEVKYLVGED